MNAAAEAEGFTVAFDDQRSIHDRQLTLARMPTAVSNSQVPAVMNCW